MRIAAVILLMSLIPRGCMEENQKRHHINLNGEWEITRTDAGSNMPENFSSRIQVPGLIDMAVPVLDDQNRAYDNSLYWYRKSFKVNFSLTNNCLSSFFPVEVFLFLSGGVLNVQELTDPLIKTGLLHKFAQSIEAKLDASVGVEDQLLFLFCHHGNLLLFVA